MGLESESVSNTYIRSMVYTTWQFHDAYIRTYAHTLAFTKARTPGKEPRFSSSKIPIHVSASTLLITFSQPPCSSNPRLPHSPPPPSSLHSPLPYPSPTPTPPLPLPHPSPSLTPPPPPLPTFFILSQTVSILRQRKQSKSL